MKAIITGASSGIGADFARVLGKMGYDLILVARRRDRLNELAEEIGGNVKVIVKDLSVADNCIELFEETKNENIDILINNAGFGVFGEFLQTDLEREISMINTNITALHILMKKFLQLFKDRDNGYILNIASSAAFMPGPLLSSYYASKAYVLRLTQAVAKELSNSKSNVYIGALCPGPVDTEFNKVAGVQFNISSLKSDYVAKYAVKKMFKRKTVIIPGLIIRLGTFFTRFVPNKLLLTISYNIQKKKK